MKKSIVFLLFAMIAIGSHAQLLWKVSGNGLNKPSYILGTHHLASLSIKDSIAGLQAAFDSTNQLIGELNMMELQTSDIMQIIQKKINTETDTTFQSLFKPEEYEAIRNCVQENLQFDVAMTPKVKPSFLQNNLLVMLYIKHVQSYNPMEQLDTHFQIEGKAKGKRIMALETPEFQFDLLYNGTSLKRQAEVLLCLINNIEKNIEQNKEMTALYMKQDLDGLLKLTEERNGDQCDPLPGEMEAMVDRRNEAWVKKLPAMIKTDPAFVVVGALHLPGTNGLLNLLKKQGYTVEAVNNH